jgi:hypothetical protein
MGDGNAFVQKFFDLLEEQTLTDMEDCQETYHTIGPLMSKLEGLVVNTNTLKAPRLKYYLLWWERLIFETMTKVRGTGLLVWVDQLVERRPLDRKVTPILTRSRRRDSSTTSSGGSGSSSRP